MAKCVRGIVPALSDLEKVEVDLRIRNEGQAVDSLKEMEHALVARTDQPEAPP